MKFIVSFPYVTQRHLSCLRHNDVSDISVVNFFLEIKKYLNDFFNGLNETSCTIIYSENHCTFIYSIYTIFLKVDSNSLPYFIFVLGSLLIRVVFKAYIELVNFYLSYEKSFMLSGRYM